MKTTAKIMVSVFFIILMVGGAYACDDDAACSGGNPPIWQIFKNGKAVHWVDWKDNRRFAIYRSGTPNDPSDDMVLDKETGLVWERSPSSRTFGFSWDSALGVCNELIVGNRRGWRLPTIQELANLTDPTQSNPSLPAGHPFSNVQLSYHWSATAFAGSPSSFAWEVNFKDGVVGLSNKSDLIFIWCVRGGQGVDAQ